MRKMSSHKVFMPPPPSSKTSHVWVKRQHKISCHPKNEIFMSAQHHVNTNCNSDQHLTRSSCQPENLFQHTESHVKGIRLLKGCPRSRGPYKVRKSPAFWPPLLSGGSISQFCSKSSWWPSGYFAKSKGE